MWAANHSPIECNNAVYLHFSQLKTQKKMESLNLNVSTELDFEQ